jgi:hypothetical protein
MFSWRFSGWRGGPYLLNSRGLDLEVSRNITSENSSLQRFDMSSDVRLRRQQMPIIHIAMSLLVPVWHDNLPSKSLNLSRQKFNEMQNMTKNPRTISKVSHKVPLPLRSTSSALSGMILQREKMNG